MNVQIEKLKRSAALVLSSMIVMIVPLLTGELIDFIQTGNAIDYKTSLILAIGASSTFIVNAAKQLKSYLSRRKEAKD